MPGVTDVIDEMIPAYWAGAQFGIQQVSPRGLLLSVVATAMARDGDRRLKSLTLDQHTHADGHNAGIVSEIGHDGRSYQVMIRPAEGHYVDRDAWVAAAPRIARTCAGDLRAAAVSASTLWSDRSKRHTSLSHLHSPSTNEPHLRHMG
jgi:hypothetical protein